MAAVNVLAHQRSLRSNLDRVHISFELPGFSLTKIHAENSSSSSSPDDSRLTTSELKKISRLYLIPIVGIVLYVVLDAVVQSLPPHYSPIRDAESDLAVGPYGYIMAINFVNRGVLSLVFVFAFTKTINLSSGRQTAFRSGLYMLGVWGVGALLLAAFPTDSPSSPVSWHGAIHLIVALSAFICGGVGVFSLSKYLGEDPATSRIKNMGLALGSVSMFLLVLELLSGFIIPRLARNFGGLIERLFLGSVLLWILVLSVYLFSRNHN